MCRGLLTHLVGTDYNPYSPSSMGWRYFSMALPWLRPHMATTKWSFEQGNWRTIFEFGVAYGGLLRDPLALVKPILVGGLEHFFGFSPVGIMIQSDEVIYFSGGYTSTTNITMEMIFTSPNQARFLIGFPACLEVFFSARCHMAQGRCGHPSDFTEVTVCYLADIGVAWRFCVEWGNNQWVPSGKLT